MKVTTTEIKDVFIIEPKVFHDSRGYFFETFQAKRYPEHAIPTEFPQDNFSHSTRHTLRGLHYQLEQPQGKLVYVVYGKVMDVVVDIRKSSPTFGKVFTFMLDAENPKQIYLPPGCAHGFCVLSETAGFVYKCTDYYHPASEFGVAWNDPALKINWPTATPELSPKDAIFPYLKDIPSERLPA